MNINVTFCRELLKQVHAEVKRKYPDVNLVKDAWVWDLGNGHWEFHGPNDFYWHGSADNAYDARYHGWSAWLSKQENQNATSSHS